MLQKFMTETNEVIKTINKAFNGSPFVIDTAGVNTYIVYNTDQNEAVATIHWDEIWMIKDINTDAYTLMMFARVLAAFDEIEPQY